MKARHRLFSVFLLLAIFSFHDLQAQRRTDTIEIVKYWAGYRFKINSQPVRINQLLELTYADKESFPYMLKARNGALTSTIIGYAGGSVLGAWLGLLTVGEKPGWQIAAVGTGLVMLSITVHLKATRNAKKAVDIYNRNTPKHSLHHFPHMEIGVTGGQAGIRINF